MEIDPPEMNDQRNSARTNNFSSTPVASTLMQEEPFALQAQCRRCGTPLGGLPGASAQSFCENCRLDEVRACCDPHAFSDLYARFAETLAATLDLREFETGQHSKRVACHTQVLARRFVVDPDELRQIYWGSLLHDIGKIGIPDAILLKTGPLNPAEWTVMKSHPEAGYRLVSTIPGMVRAADLVLAHEERFDGSGYPRGLAGSQIPFGARLFAVIDTLDAMTSDRPYRQGMSFEAAKTEICRQSRTQFDPVAVEAFLAEEETLREMVKLKCCLENGGSATQGG